MGHQKEVYGHDVTKYKGKVGETILSELTRNGTMQAADGGIRSHARAGLFNLHLEEPENHSWNINWASQAKLSAGEARDIYEQCRRLIKPLCMFWASIHHKVR